MTTFLPLQALQSAVDGVKSDLAKARGINTILQKKINNLDKDAMKAEFLARQSAKLREEASGEIRQYLQERGTYEHMASIAAQADSWTVSKFLRRAVAVPEPFLGQTDTGTDKQLKLAKTHNALLRVNNLLLTVTLMDVEALTETADDAFEAKDWQTASACFNALTGRAKTDEAARVAVGLLARRAADIPDVLAAKDLIEQGDRVNEYLGYCLRAIATGGPDDGARYEILYDDQSEKAVFLRSQRLPMREFLRQMNEQSAA